MSNTRSRPRSPHRTTLRPRSSASNAAGGGRRRPPPPLLLLIMALLPPAPVSPSACKACRPWLRCMRLLQARSSARRRARLIPADLARPPPCPPLQPQERCQPLQPAQGCGPLPRPHRGEHSCGHAGASGGRPAPAAVPGHPAQLPTRPHPPPARLAGLAPQQGRPACSSPTRLLPAHPLTHSPTPHSLCLQRWFYNKQSAQCEQFMWGGCKGNKVGG